MKTDDSSLDDDLTILRDQCLSRVFNLAMRHDIPDEAWGVFFERMDKELANAKETQTYRQPLLEEVKLK